MTQIQADKATTEANKVTIEANKAEAEQLKADAEKRQVEYASVLASLQANRQALAQSILRCTKEKPWASPPYLETLPQQ